MATPAAAHTNGRQEAAPLYVELQERLLARDQEGGSRIYYELLRRGRPLPEIMAEAVRIHAPYTHVPYHQRIDDGFPNFVNNDHCLLSARAAINLQKMLPERLAGLPLAQTIWYIPSGLDIWNQKILKAPGHYASRGYKMPNTTPPKPVVYWPDQEPLREAGPLSERLNHWLTLVERGQVIDAYRTFLGLMEETEHRQEVLAQLVFAGMIDVQDRMLYNRSYTTGHKAYRARSVVEIGNAVGWDNAHDVVYAGALDIAVGPRWHSVYEMACNVITIFIEDKEVHAVPRGGTTERERTLLANSGMVSEAETEELIDALVRQHEPAYIEKISALLLAGKSPRRIVDIIQLAAAQIVLETDGPSNFSMPQHTYEYCNTLGWFFDNFAHPQRLKLLYVAGSMVNQAAWNQRSGGWLKSDPIGTPRGADRLTGGQIIERLEAALAALDAAGSVAWTKAYLDSGADRSLLVQRLALMAARFGNDPHNQEIPQCMLEDYGRNRCRDRERLLLACAHISAGHRKYGDPLDASRRFGEAMGLAELQ
jgi:AcrR family transcriptional regulator